MQKDVFTLEGRSVTLCRQEDPRILFLQPVDEHDEGLLDRQLALMERSLLPFALAAFSIRDWNKELSPWEAPPVFGKQPFGGGAGETLAFLTQHLLPELRGRCVLGKNGVLCLGGYSLAGLFALWAGTRTSLFTGLAAASLGSGRKDRTSQYSRMTERNWGPKSSAFLKPTPDTVMNSSRDTGSFRHMSISALSLKMM